ncbi:MAG: hypothetical protein H0U32_11285 [Thermoleophilaceae bacterium]|nr:hypothetical protein [Thermoleophilaceae bacterium]
MNSVNLLPGHLRPREAAGARQNGAYIALGVLGVLLLAVTMYVIALNGITSNENELAELQARKTQSDLRAGALSSFGDFQQVKATRVASVKGLAEANHLGVVGAEAVARALEPGLRGLRALGGRAGGRDLGRHLPGLVALGRQQEKPVAEQQQKRDEDEDDLAIAVGHAHDPPPSEAGAWRVFSVTGAAGASTTVAAKV